MAEEMQQQAIQTTTEAMAAHTVEKDVRNSPTCLSCSTTHANSPLSFCSSTPTPLSTLVPRFVVSTSKPTLRIILQPSSLSSLLPFPSIRTNRSRLTSKEISTRDMVRHGTSWLGNRSVRFVLTKQIISCIGIWGISLS